MEQQKLKFPGFPEKPEENYWQYPKICNGWWHLLSGAEQKVLDYLLRHTWGYQKYIDSISLSQFRDGIKNADKGTGLSLPTIIKAIRGLNKKGFIIVIEPRQLSKLGIITTYMLRKKGDEPERILLQDYLYNEVEGNCPYCGVKMYKNRVYEPSLTNEEKQKLCSVDHIIPRSEKGSNRISNLIACCFRCNIQKNKTLPEKWIRYKFGANKDSLVGATKDSLVGATKESLDTIRNVTINNNNIRLATPTILKRKEIKFEKKNYDDILEVYQKFKGITLQGKEFEPCQQSIKTMFMSGRTKEQIVEFMSWIVSVLEESKEDEGIARKYVWLENWTLDTIKKKMPEFLAGKFQKVDEDIEIPSYAKNFQKNV